MVVCGELGDVQVWRGGGFVESRCCVEICVDLLIDEERWRIESI